MTHLSKSLGNTHQIVRKGLVAELGKDLTDPDRARLASALTYALGAEGDASDLLSLRVVETLKRLGVDADTLVAGVLSDPRLQDFLAQETIAEQFGPNVAALVRSIRWLNSFSECREGLVQGPGQAERLRRMLLAMVEDVRAVLVKLAYRVERLRIVEGQADEIRRCLARETMEIFAPLANRLGVGQLKWELEDLAFRYLDPAAYQSVANLLEESRTQREAFINTVIEELRSALAREGIEAEVSGRPKHVYSIWCKMQRKGQEFHQLNDLRACRVIVTRLADCYAALGVIHSLWQHIPREFDDYIANPKDNGYQSLHTAVVGPDGKLVEVQIRTREMHELGELGVAAHWRYKEGGRHDQALERSIASLRRLLDSRDDDAELLEGFRAELYPDRVFVLTPKGQVMDLIRGATPLDFAYAVHTEVGHRCRGAKVNGRIVPLSYELQSGQRVEVLTTKTGGPSRDWLNPRTGYLRTPRARAKVRQWFKHLDFDRNVADGRRILDHECDRLGIHDPELAHLAGRFNFARADEFLAAVGRGDVGLTQIANSLQVPSLPAVGLQDLRSRRSPGSASSSGKIRIHGVGNLLTQVAGCCKPVPGDPITGYITVGMGVTVHRKDCRNVLRLPPERLNRLVQVSWGPEQACYAVDIHIEAFDRQGLLRDITSVLANEKVNVRQANTRTSQTDQTVAMDITLEITDTAQLSTVLDKIAQVQNVLQVKRHA